METELDAFLCWWETTFCSGNTNTKLFVKTAEPINQLNCVKISLCVEANIWTQERGDNQCSVSLPVFFLIPQDISLCLHRSSLMPQLVYRFLPVSVCLRFWSHSYSSSSLCLSFLLTHFLALHLFSCLSLFVSVCIFLLVVRPPLLHRSLRTVVFTLCLFVSFSSSRGWRRVSPSWLPRGCCGNNSCHFVVQKLTEKNEKRAKMHEWKYAKHQLLQTSKLKFGFVLP